MVRVLKSDVDMSSGEYKDKQGGGAGLPLTKSENNDGKKTLTNGMSRVHRIYTDEEIAQGKSTRWTELEIHGRVRNLSPALWKIQHLSALFLNGNQLQRLPPEISQLTHLTMLDLSNNKLRSLPAELGDMITLCHLYLNNNLLRVLPYELGKLFRVQTLGLQGNPLSPEISKIYHESNGSQRILQFLLDHLTTFAGLRPTQKQCNWICLSEMALKGHVDEIQNYLPAGERGAHQENRSVSDRSQETHRKQTQADEKAKL